MKNKGAELADLWRYVLLYEYGGLYIDIDDAPGDWLIQNPDMVTERHDAVFCQKPGGSGISQNFFWSSPKHPLMYFTILEVFRELLELPDVGAQYIPVVTGPGAIKRAWQHFVSTSTTINMDGKRGRNDIFAPGHYHNDRYNRSIDVLEGKEHINNKSALAVYSPEYYAATAMEDYERNKRASTRQGNRVACYDVLYDVFSASASNGKV